MLAYLESLYISCNGNVRVAVHAAWILAFGVVRYAHIQRSTPKLLGSKVLICHCVRGKVGGKPFTWCLPRYTPGGHDMGKDIWNNWVRMRRPQYLLPEPASGLMLAAEAVVNSLRVAFSEVLPDAHLLTT